MGNWGYKLYQDDIAQDVRDEYVDLLRKGTSGENAAKRLADQYRSLNEEDAAVFWFALADTMWNYGRLTVDVRAEALKYLENRTDLCRWYEQDPKNAEKRAAELELLERRLCSPQPGAKPVKPYRLYRCQWKIGDIFAYRLDGAEAKESPYESCYAYFVKVGEQPWHPGHTIPVVYFFRTVSDELVSIEQLKEAGYLPQFFVPAVYEKSPDRKRLYRVALVCTSARSIPKKLLYMGNMGAVCPIKNEDMNAYALQWKRFDSYVIQNISNWGIRKPLE